MGTMPSFYSSTLCLIMAYRKVCFQGQYFMVAVQKVDELLIDGQRSRSAVGYSGWP